jgi:protein SCO1/2
MGGCSREKALPVYWQVPAFQLTWQAGKPFDSSLLDGKIWAADFIYTNCPGPCPRISSQMRGIQTAIANMPDVKLVSFTVDPARDTPEVLLAYAGRYRAIPGRWYFLTGEPASLQALCREGFKLGDVDGKMTHSTRFVLVDRHRRIRGFYGSQDDGGVPQLLHDIRRLRAEQS